MKINLKIRKADEFDVDSLNKLNLESFKESTMKLDFSKFIDKSNYKIIIASQKINIIGYLLTLNHDNNLFEIISIAVDSFYKREGIASNMLSDFLSNKKVNSKII